MRRSAGELAVASVYVAPALLESFGLAALEARTVGLPVVACGRGGVGEFVVHRVNGLLTLDDDDMVSALAELVMDGASRAELTANNRAQPRSWTGRPFAGSTPTSTHTPWAGRATAAVRPGRGSP